MRFTFAIRPRPTDRVHRRLAFGLEINRRQQATARSVFTSVVTAGRASRGAVSITSPAAWSTVPRHRLGSVPNRRALKTSDTIWFVQTGYTDCPQTAENFEKITRRSEDALNQAPRLRRRPSAQRPSNYWGKGTEEFCFRTFRRGAREPYRSTVFRRRPALQAGPVRP
jgi:hypothetical protein